MADENKQERYARYITDQLKNPTGKFYSSVPKVEDGVKEHMKTVHEKKLAEAAKKFRRKD